MESVMNISRLALVTALGLGLSSTGCIGNTDPLVEDIEAPHFKTLEDPGGGIKPNGLTPAAFHANKYKLRAAMEVRLAPPSPLQDSMQVSEEFLATGLLGTDDGKLTFRYAVACALPSSNIMLTGSILDENDNPAEYHGAALLTTTGSWRTGGLSVSARKDLWMCMIAHLNPFGESVEVLLSGESVKDQSATQPNQVNFTFNEALWSVTMASAPSSVPFFHVWPMRDLASMCPPRIVGALQTRFCSGYGGFDGCDLDVRSNIGADCTEESGHYTCFGAPAIRTRLEPTSVSKLYNGCAPIP
jgi:hypothetical protein